MLVRAVGAIECAGAVLDHIGDYFKGETIRLDPDHLEVLYQQIGKTCADDIVCRAVEELAVRLSCCERLFRDEYWGDLRKCCRSLIAIAEQVGMASLAKVAGDVTCSIDRCDMVATAATLHRLLRIGERSLTAVWDLQDLSV
ncbi:MAG: hypothetical protein AB3N13_03050 [Arenibacterium sp.]